MALCAATMPLFSEETMLEMVLFVRLWVRMVQARQVQGPEVQDPVLKLIVNVALSDISALCQMD